MSASNSVFLKKYKVDLLIIFSLVVLVFGIRFVRGNPPPIAHEPAKIRGKVDAPIFLVEFTDYQCPYCKKIQPTLHKVLETFPNDVKIIYKHFPLDFIHSQSRRVAEASECAADQNKFWEYSDLLYEKTMEWGVFQEEGKADPTLHRYAVDLGLDLERFQTCMNSGEKKQVVENNKAEGKKLFVSGTPTLLLNGNKVIVNHDFEKIKIQIEKEIAMGSGR